MKPLASVCQSERHWELCCQVKMLYWVIILSLLNICWGVIFQCKHSQFYLHTKPLPLNRPVVNKTQADRQNDWFMRGIDAFAISVCHKSQSVCKFKKCRHEKPYISLTCEMSLALVCLMTDCIMLRENLFERDVSALTERDHFHLLHIKISYDINTCNCTFFFFFFFTNACKPFN